MVFLLGFVYGVFFGYSFEVIRVSGFFILFVRVVWFRDKDSFIVSAVR